MTGRVARATLAGAVLAVGLPFAGPGHADACPGRSVGRWSRLAAPRESLQVVPLRTTCALLAVSADGTLRRSADGRRFAPVAGGTDRVFADGRTGIVVAALRGGGVLVSGDDGATFAHASGVADPAVAAAVSRGDPPVVVVATAITAVATALWRSDDGGASFRPAGTMPVPAAALAFDAWSVDVLWLAAGSSAGAGLWQSADAGTTWQRVLAGPAHDVDTARGAANGLAVVARADGLWRTTDLGATWRRTPSAALSAARVDSGGPGAVALGGAHPLTVPGTGHPTTLADGLPSGCAARDLAADAARPTTYVVRCGEAWYTQVSAADVTVSASGPAQRGVPVTGRPLLALAPLRQLALPAADGASSGSLAFDGRTLYYAGEFAPARGSGDPVDVVHRMSPVDGRDLGTLAPGVPAKFLGYDSRRDRLYVDDGHAMWRVDLATGQRRLAFPASYGYQDSYDPFSRTFLGVAEGSEEKAMLFLDESGRLRGHCSLAAAIDAALTTVPYPSAIVAAADGAYVLLEDDTTVIRIGRDCGLRATYLTRKISESTRENDELVCDPMTFAPRTALWIRDSDLATVTAYDLPGGYCPFVSTLAVTAPPTVRAGGATVVCATVRGAARGEPVAGQAVGLDLGGVHLAAPPTDARGRTCADTTAPRAPGPRTVRARYAGTPQWSPATATAVTTVLPGLPRQDSPEPTGSAPRLAAVGLAAGAGAGPAPPNAPPEPLHLPQHHPQPQQHPGQQPGAQAGYAPDSEDAPQLAVAETRDDAASGTAAYAMSRRATTPALTLLLGAAVLTGAASWGLRRAEAAEPIRAVRRGR